MEAVLVAGGAGYIGAHTCKALARAGFLPITLDNLSTGYRAAVKWGPLIEASINDRVAIADAISRHNIKSAVHFAASSIVGESVRLPLNYYSNNVSSGCTFLESLLENGVDAIVFSSTAAVYGVPQHSPIGEDHPLSPINPYGGTKVAFEQVLHWASQAHQLRYTVLRYFNAAGADLDGEAGESHVPETHLVPLICAAAAGKGSSLTVFGSDYDTRDGTAIRDYVHVADLADAHVSAIIRLRGGGDNRIYNAGSGAGVTVRELLDTAERVLGRPVPYTIGARRPGDPASLVADISRIQSELRWRPLVSDLDTIVRSASSWLERAHY